MNNNSSEENMQVENQQAIASLKEIALASLKEQRAARRWKIFFMLLFALMFFLFIFSIKTASTMAAGGARFTTADEYTAVVDIKGVIMADADASAENIIPVLQEAFEDDKAKGIILDCKSIVINVLQYSGLQLKCISTITKPLKHSHLEHTH